MKALLASLLLVLALAAPSRAANLLLNGNFETPTGAATGNNIGTVPANWVVSTVAGGAPTSNLSNLVKGNANGTQALGVTTPVLLSPYNDGSATHLQSLDGVGQTIVVYQSFTLNAPSAVSVSLVFGGRDYTSGLLTGPNAAPSNWAVRGTTASGTSTAPPQGTWVSDNGTTGLLPAGTYEFDITLGNPDQVDAVVLTLVPEPATWAILCGGVVIFAAFAVRSRRQTARPAFV